MFRIIITFFCLISSISAEDLNLKKVYILPFESFRGKEEKELNAKILTEIQSELKNLGFLVIPIPSDRKKEETFSKLQTENAFLIAGHYERTKTSVDLFGQIYNTKTGKLIDAVKISDLSSEWEGIQLDADEFKTTDEEKVKKFTTKLSLRIKTNPGKKTYLENIEENLLQTPIAKENKFLIDAESNENAIKDTFRFLEDTEVVTATRTKTKIKEAPAAIYLISSKQIKERGYRTLSDALHDVPGMDFQHNYGIYPDLIHQRGLVGGMQRTLLYIDGIPDNNLNENAMLAGSVRFPLQNVERIEIISGPASVLYGANAFNGIINIITKDGIQNPGNHVETTYGSYEASRNSNYSRPGYGTNIALRGSSEGETPIQYSIFGYYFQTEGPNMGGIQKLNPKNNGATEESPNYNYKFDPVYRVSNQLCGNTMCDPNKNSIGYFWSDGYNVSSEKTYNITAKFSKGGLRFQTINWQYLQGQGTFPNGTEQIDQRRRGSLGLPGLNGSAWDFRSNSVLIGYDAKISEKLNIDTEGIVRHSEILNSSREQYPNQTGPSATYRPTDITQSDQYSRPDYGYFGESRINYNHNSSLSTTLGLFVRNYVVGKDYGSSDRYQYSNFAIYLQQTYRPVSKITLSAGFRRDYITTYGYASTPRASIIYQITPKLNLKFLIGQAFREPSAIELFSLTPQRKPNPSLSPEKLTSVELGLGYRFSKALYSSIQTFYNTNSDLILQVQTNDRSTIETITPNNPWLQNQNVGRARIYGVETETDWKVTNKWNLNLNYTFTEGYYFNLPSSLTASPSTEGRIGESSSISIESILYKELLNIDKVPEKGKIPNISPHKIFVGNTYYPISKLSLYSGINYVDIRRTIATNPESSVPGYTVLKINIRYEDFWKEGMYIQIQANNVLNQQFFDPGIRTATGEYFPTRHPLEKRNVWITLGYNF